MNSASSPHHKIVDAQQSRATTPLMQVRDLRKSFGGETVLDGLSFELLEGEVVLLRGNNGSGKTTLLNILTGNLQPDAGAIYLSTDGSKEHFRFPRRWWQEANPLSHFTPERVANERVGRTWQDIRLFETMNVIENVAVAKSNHPGESPTGAFARYFASRDFERTNDRESRQLLVDLGLTECAMSSSANRLSLGQMKRVAIARAIRAGTRILFLDEPLAGLDARGIADMLSLLSSLVQQQFVTLVIVEHVFNIPHILNLADTIWTLHDGKITVERTRRLHDENFGSSDVAQKLVEVLSSPGSKIIEHLFPGGASLLHITTTQSECRSALLAIRSPVVRRNGRLVLGQKSSTSSRPSLSIALQRGDAAILRAPNGWGKTTLLEAVAGVVAVTEGVVQLRGVDMLPLPTWTRWRMGLRFMPARAALFPNLSISDFDAFTHGRPDVKWSPEGSRRLLGELSGGQRQRIALGQILDHDTIALLDEPLLGLDSASVAAIGETLRHYLSELAGTLLITLPATHNDSLMSEH